MLIIIINFTLIGFFIILTQLLDKKGVSVIILLAIIIMKIAALKSHLPHQEWTVVSIMPMDLLIAMVS